MKLSEVNWGGIIFTELVGGSIGYLCGDVLAGMAWAFVVMAIFSLIIEPLFFP